jgi:hypothetical protein
MIVIQGNQICLDMVSDREEIFLEPSKPHNTVYGFRTMQFRSYISVCIFCLFAVGEAALIKLLFLSLCSGYASNRQLDTINLTNILHNSQLSGVVLAPADTSICAQTRLNRAGVFATIQLAICSSSLRF